VVLGYVYQYCFFCKLQKNDQALKDVLFVAGIFESQDEYEEQKKAFVDDVLAMYLEHDAKEELWYSVKHFFDKRDIKDIDMNYVFDIGSKLVGYYDLSGMFWKHPKKFCSMNLLN